MQFPTWRRWQEVSLFCLLFEGLVGCGGTELISSKQREIEDLKFENARKRDSLMENLAERDQLEQLVRDLEGESSSLQKQVLDLGTHLRFANDKVTSLSSERDTLRAKLAEAETSVVRFQENLEKVKSVASASAGELADLRLKRQELESSLKNLTQNQNGLANENATLSREVEQLRGDLVRTRAAVRSLQEGGPQEGGTVSTDVEDRIKGLEQEIADLKGENTSLKKATEALRAEVALPPSGSRGKGKPPVVAARERTPEGLFQELGALVKERTRNALKGAMKWDLTDFVLIGLTAVLLLLFLWISVRQVRWHRLSRQVRLLTARVLEIEAPVLAPSSAPEPSAPQASRGEGEGGRGRRSPTARRSGFSPVISTKNYPPGSSEKPSEGDLSEEPDEDERSSVAPARSKVLSSREATEGGDALDALGRLLEESTSQQAAARPRGTGAERERAVVGRKVAPHSRESSPAHEDELQDLANTQIIPRVTEEDIQSIDLAPNIARAGPGGKGSSSFGTEAKSVVTSVQRPKAAAESSVNDDRQLLSELKAVINKKFDELLK